MTLADDVAALQNRISAAQRGRARAEGARDAAQAALQRAHDELRHDFHVDSTEQGVQLLTELRKQLDGLTAEITAKLDQIGI